MTPGAFHSYYHVNSPLTPHKWGGFSFSRVMLTLKRLFVDMKIDTNPYPCIREGMSIDSHVGIGTIVWEGDQQARKFFFSEEQFSGKGITGHNFLNEIRLMPVMNARVLDWLLANPHEIPVNAWQGKKIFFWGTIYTATNGSLYVRYIDCSGRYSFEDVFCLNNTLESDARALLY